MGGCYTTEEMVPADPNSKQPENHQEDALKLRKIRETYCLRRLPIWSSDPTKKHDITKVVEYPKHRDILQLVE